MQFIWQFAASYADESHSPFRSSQGLGQWAMACQMLNVQSWLYPELTQPLAWLEGDNLKAL
jgi:hypothetical protein